MPLSEEARLAMIATTHSAALAMEEDVRYLRELVEKPRIEAAEIRRASNVLRRLLVDNNGDIRKIAPPRIGMLTFAAPEISTFIRSARRQEFTFWASGGAPLFDMRISAMIFDEGPTRTDVADHNPDATISLKIDGFLAQPVICFRGQWVTRGDAIKYVANVAHGVHSSDPREPNHELLDRIRHAASVRMTDQPEFSLNLNTMLTGVKALAIDRVSIDFVLLELLSAAYFVVNSPDVQRLEQIIRQEHVE